MHKVWPEEILGSTEIILAHNLLNNARHFPLDTSLTLPRRNNLARRLYNVEDAVVNLNSHRGSSRLVHSMIFRWKVYQLKHAYDAYNLAKIRASFDGSIPQDQLCYRQGIATEEVVEDPCTCREKHKCPGHRRSILEIHEPSNLYIPCREGCLMPAEWMLRKLS